MALAAIEDYHGEEQIVAVARYATLSFGEPGWADFAIVVQDEYQEHGLGTILLKRLAACARANHLRAFIAMVCSENQRMLRFLRHSGFPIKTLEASCGELKLAIDLGVAQEHIQGDENHGHSIERASVLL
jgi:GNAT superfamily N-acetyltransferase